MWFIVTIIVLVVIYHVKSVNVNNVYFLYKKRLSKSECEELIDMSKRYTLETKLDGVDDKPEYQIEIYTKKQYVFIINISGKDLHVLNTPILYF